MVKEIFVVDFGFGENFRGRKLPSGSLTCVHVCILSPVNLYCSFSLEKLRRNCIFSTTHIFMTSILFLKVIYKNGLDTEGHFTSSINNCLLRFFLHLNIVL